MLLVFYLICAACYLLLSKASCFMSDMSGRHMGNMWSRLEGSLVQELKINWNIRLKKNRSAEEWAGDDKTHITKEGKEGICNCTEWWLYKKAHFKKHVCAHLLSRMLSKVHWSFLKKGWHLISSTPVRPSRTVLHTAEAERLRVESPKHTLFFTHHHKHVIPKHANGITAVRWPHWPAWRAAAAENLYSVTPKHRGNNQ